MSTELDVEQLQSTKSEKLLALVLAVFLLIGGIWAYQEIDDKVRDAMPVRNPTAAEQQAIRTLDRAQQRRFRAEETVRRTRSELELRARGVSDGARRRGSGGCASRPVPSCRRRLRGSARRPGACDTGGSRRTAGGDCRTGAGEPRCREAARPAGARDLSPAHERGGPVRTRRIPDAHAAARQGLPLVSTLGLGGALRDRLRSSSSPSTT